MAGQIAPRIENAGASARLPDRVEIDNGTTGDAPGPEDGNRRIADAARQRVAKLVREIRIQLALGDRRSQPLLRSGTTAGRNRRDLLLHGLRIGLGGAHLRIAGDHGQHSHDRDKRQSRFKHVSQPASLAGKLYHADAGRNAPKECGYCCWFWRLLWRARVTSSSLRRSICSAKTRNEACCFVSRTSSTPSRALLISVTVRASMLARLC